MRSYRKNKRKTKLLFVITQFYKGGAEVALLNLFQSFSPEEYQVDFLIFDQMALKDARTLTEQIPSWIRVCDAAEREGRLAVFVKIWVKIVRRITKRQLYRSSAYRFVRYKKYDAAFSYGEWLAPEFVARKVRAKKKFVWIHTDIDKAKSVDENILFRFDRQYQGYIFVSRKSKECAQERFPVCRGRSTVIHNMCADDRIRSAALEAVTGISHYTRPWLLSVGNLREEKNYPRQIEVMRILKERGVTLTWFCIGSRANVLLDRQIRTKIQQYGLQEQFVLLGMQDNPYKYMKQADAVTVLSDFESWSMVITEAKLLGVPVIATPTSGAFEQLEDGKTGVVTAGFDAEAIADRIQWFFQEPRVQERIQRNLAGFSTNQEVLREFCSILRE